MKPHLHRRLSILGLLCLVAWMSSCGSEEGSFTRGRLEARCNESIPACDTQAACILSNNDYYDGQFPGGQKVLVRTDTKDATLVARFLLTDMSFPGTEFQVVAHSVGCDSFDELHLVDIDIFNYAGDDRIIQAELELDGAGDHLVSIYSDMNASYLMTLTIEERL